jgi:hypothetical protein
MNRISNILIIGLIIISNLSFSQKVETKELKSCFTKEQINDLVKIVDFFTNQISNDKNDNFIIAFETILPQLIENGWIPILETVDFEEQKQMYNSISSDTFDEIWSYAKKWIRGDTITYKCIGLKYNGNYMKFLEEISKRHPVLERYYEDCLSAGTVQSSGYLQQNIKLLPEQFDLNDFNIQLLIAVHYLIENDDNKRKEKWNE